MFTQAARALFDAHERRERFAPLPPHLAPRSVSDAHAIQDAFVALRAGKLGAVAGYKIALTSPQMRKFVGVDEIARVCDAAIRVEKSVVKVRV